MQRDGHQGFMFRQNEAVQQSKVRAVEGGAVRAKPLEQGIDKALADKLFEKMWEAVKASHEGLAVGQKDIGDLIKQSHDDLAARLISTEERLASLEKWAEGFVTQMSGAGAPVPKKGKRNRENLLHEITVAMLSIWQNPQAQRIGMTMKKDSIANELERACGRSDLSQAVSKASTSSPLWRGFKSWFTDCVGTIRWKGIEFLIEERVMSATPAAANAPLTFLAEEKFQNLEHHGSVDNLDIEEVIKQTRIVLGPVPQGTKFKLLELIPRLDLDDNTKAALSDPSSSARAVWKKELRDQELICIADKKDFRKGEYVKGPILL